MTTQDSPVTVQSARLTASAAASYSGRPIRVCLAGPSLDILGGQAVQLARLLERLRSVPGLEVGFIAMNPRLPGPLAAL